MFEVWQEQLGDENQPAVDVTVVPEIVPTYEMPIIRTDTMPARGGQRWPRQRVPVKTFYFGAGAGQPRSPKKFNLPVVNLDQAAANGQATAPQAQPAPAAPAAKPESTGWFASLGLSPWMLLLAAGGGLLLVYFMGMTSGKKK